MENLSFFVTVFPPNSWVDVMYSQTLAQLISKHDCVFLHSQISHYSTQIAVGDARNGTKWKAYLYFLLPSTSNSVLLWSMFCVQYSLIVDPAILGIMLDNMSIIPLFPFPCVAFAQILHSHTRLLKHHKIQINEFYNNEN